MFYKVQNKLVEYFFLSRWKKSCINGTS